MQLRLNPQAEEKQRAMLEQEERNSLLKEQLSYLTRQLNEVDSNVVL